MIRVLQVFREPIANGGQEVFIMNMYRNMDHQKIQFDFFTPFRCENIAFKTEAESYGSRIISYDNEFGVNNNISFVHSLNSFLKQNYYEIVHFHSGSTFALAVGPYIAKKYGSRVRIIHSHCGGFDNIKYRTIKYLSKPAMMKYPTDYFACSDLAARWKFPNEIISNKSYHVIKNAVNLDVFKYNELDRKAIRSELDIDQSSFVVGHVGRFDIQKNHKFIIEVFSKFKIINPSAKLMLVGSGSLESDIKRLVNERGLSDSVLFLGRRDDVSRILSAIDVFVLPSLFEGLPIAAVEAQASGLPVLVSNKVTKELPLIDSARYLDISNSDLWVKELSNIKSINRFDTSAQLRTAGYDIHIAAGSLQNFYENA